MSFIQAEKEAKQTTYYFMWYINCAAELITYQNITHELNLYFLLMNNFRVSFANLFTYFANLKNMSFKILPVQTK